jgi:hypothetical protein
MKLSAKQIVQTKDQIGAQPVPENHPAVPQLTELYGSHTFFLDSDGLEIVETTELSDEPPRAAMVVKLASWADDQHTALAPHDPRPTDVMVDFGAESPNAKA